MSDAPADARNALLRLAYRPPVSSSIVASPGVDHDSIVARLAIAWLAGMLLVQAMSTALLEWELFEPELVGTIEGHRLALDVHTGGAFILVLPLAMGIASTFVLRQATNRARTALPGLGYLGLAGWVIASILILWTAIRPDASVDVDGRPALVSPYFVALAALSCGLAAISINVVCTLWTGRDALDVWRNPLTLGLGAGAVFQLLACLRSILHAAGTWAGVRTLGSGLVTLEDLVYPVGFGLAFGLLERRDRERWWVGLGIVALGGYEFLPGPGWGVSLPIFGASLALIGIVRFTRRGPRTVAGWCAWGALVALGLLALIDGFLLGLSEDVHLHDTVFASLKPHLAALAMLLALLGWAVRGRPPRWRFAELGVVGLTGAALSAFVGLGVLGQRGMPSRYATYVDMFTSMHQFVALSGAATLVLAVVVLVAWTRRAPPPADPNLSGSARPADP